MADELLDRIVRVVRQAKGPLNIGEVADRAKVSRPTASKYILVAQAMGQLEIWSDATQRLVGVAGVKAGGHRRRQQ